MRTLNAIALGALLVIEPAWAAEWNLTDGAGVHPNYRGPVPQKSDVIFSARFKRDESAAVAKSFGATRIEWVYATDESWVKSLEQVAPWFGGTLNSNAPLPAGSGFATDFDGTPIVAPWMKSWGAKWVTTASPETRKVMAEQLERYLSWGADSIQFDDPLLQAYASQYGGGDFNPATQAGFKEWLSRHPDKAASRAAGLSDFNGDYRAFLKAKHGVKDAADYAKRFRDFPSTPLWLDYVQSTVEGYYAEVRRRLAQNGQKPVALSMNISNLFEPDESNRAFFLTGFADYLMAETPINSTAQMVSQIATARSLRLAFAPSIKPADLPRNRVAVATLYALGAPPVVPWDVFTGTEKRYFGTPEEYGDLYRFARSQERWLDGFESAALVGVAVAVDKFQAETTRAVVKKLIERHIPFAYVPVGGRSELAADTGRLRSLKLLVLANDDADYPPAELQAMAAAGMRRVRAAQVDDAVLEPLRPFVVAPGGQNVRLYTRAARAAPARVAVHVVDEARGDQKQPGGDCKRRLGLRRPLLGDFRIEQATWATPAGSVKLTPQDDGKSYVYFSLPSCPVWGVLEMDLRR